MNRTLMDNWNIHKRKTYLIILLSTKEHNVGAILVFGEEDDSEQPEL